MEKWWWRRFLLLLPFITIIVIILHFGREKIIFLSSRSYNLQVRFYQVSFPSPFSYCLHDVYFTRPHKDKTKRKKTRRRNSRKIFTFAMLKYGHIRRTTTFCISYKYAAPHHITSPVLPATHKYLTTTITPFAKSEQKRQGRKKTIICLPFLLISISLYANSLWRRGAI